MRELFVVDSFHYRDSLRTPVIIRMPHARLSAQNSCMFEICYQTLISMLVASQGIDN